MPNAAQISATQTGGCVVFELLPNCALTPRTALYLFGALSVPPLVIAIACIAVGLWPVFPITGLELAALGYAFHLSLRRRHFTETLEITEAEVIVTQRARKGARETRFSRYWARVATRPALSRHASRLLIESHGRACEVGAFLTEDGRATLARRLRTLIGGTSDAPPLSGTGIID